jgi:hypothetical protein
MSLVEKEMRNEKKREFGERERKLGQREKEQEFRTI